MLEEYGNITLLISATLDVPSTWPIDASRTKFNTEYMPWLEEDEIESNDNLRPERNVITSDIVREDNKRFFAFGRQTGWDYKKALKDFKKTSIQK